MQPLNLLKKLVSFSSAYPQEKEVGNFLVTYLKEIGFEVTIQEISSGRNNIFAQKNKKGKAILFYGHQDTVPIANPQSWNTQPLELTEKDGRYYGLGVVDIKGGIAAILEATKQTEAYIKVFLAVDEENISEGAWKAVQDEKTKYFFEDVQLVISVEPNFGVGENTIAIGRTGRVVYQTEFNGLASHIANYKKGVDAIWMMSNFIGKLYGQRDDLFSSQYTVAQIRKVSGESVGMSVCAQAVAEVEVLLGPGDTREAVRVILEGISDGGVISLKSRKTPYLQGYKFETFPYQDLVAQIVEQHTGKPIEKVLRSSVGDDNVFAELGIPVITWGPVGGNEHTANEFIKISSFEKIIKMYSSFVNSL